MLIVIGFSTKAVFRSYRHEGNVELKFPTIRTRNVVEDWTPETWIRDISVGHAWKRRRRNGNNLWLPTSSSRWIRNRVVSNRSTTFRFSFHSFVGVSAESRQIGGSNFHYTVSRSLTRGNTRWLRFRQPRTDIFKLNRTEKKKGKRKTSECAKILCKCLFKLVISGNTLSPLSFNRNTEI